MKAPFHHPAGKGLETALTLTAPASGTSNALPVLTGSTAPAFELDEPPQAPRNKGAQISKMRMIFFMGRARHLKMNSLVFINNSMFG
jgi:hypothetical protein